MLIAFISKYFMDFGAVWLWLFGMFWFWDVNQIRKIYIFIEGCNVNCLYLQVLYGFWCSLTMAFWNVQVCHYREVTGNLIWCWCRENIAPSGESYEIDRKTMNVGWEIDMYTSKSKDLRIPVSSVTSDDWVSTWRLQSHINTRSWGSEAMSDCFSWNSLKNVLLVAPDIEICWKY